MAKKRPQPDPLHFLFLEVENIRSFAGRQKLDLHDPNHPSKANRWCLILGENGVGKTTLLQSLAVLRPVPAVGTRPGKGKDDDGVPTLAEAELAGRQNAEVEQFARRGASKAVMSACLVNGAGKKLKTSAAMTIAKDELETASFPFAKYKLRSDGPLVLSYGAARHLGHGNKSSVAQRDISTSLFLGSVDLYDAEELLEELDHAARKGPKELRARDRARLKAVLAAVASLLEDRKPADIEYRGPRVPGRKASECGVHVKTPSGVVPLTSLSLGYQSMFAWTVDLAWRLLEAFPDSDTPMKESAVVLVDEIDLHLHPRWQRDLRCHMLKHFPNVQFIATTHSPITAQDAIAEGGTVAVVHWHEGEAHIITNPLPRHHWRVDQLVTSELFDFGAPRTKEAEKKLMRRVELLRKLNRTRSERAELTSLDAFAAGLPTSCGPVETAFEDLMASYRRDFPEGSLDTSR